MVVALKNNETSMDHLFSQANLTLVIIRISISNQNHIITRNLSIIIINIDRIIMSILIPTIGTNLGHLFRHKKTSLPANMFIIIIIIVMNPRMMMMTTFRHSSGSIIEGTNS